MSITVNSAQNNYISITLNSSRLDEFNRAVTTINQHYQQQQYNFELVNLRGSRYEISELFARIARIPRVYSINLKVTAAAESAEVVKTIIEDDEFESSMEGYLYVRLDNPPKNVPRITDLLSKMAPVVPQVGEPVPVFKQHSHLASKLNVLDVAITDETGVYVIKIVEGVKTCVAILKNSTWKSEQKLVEVLKNIDTAKIKSIAFNGLIGIDRQFINTLMSYSRAEKIHFPNCDIHLDAFIALAEFQNSKTVEFKLNGTIDGNTWPKWVSHLVKNHQRLRALTIDVDVQVGSLTFLDSVINSSSSLKGIDLRGLSFSPNTLIEWLFKERASVQKIENDPTLYIFLYFTESLLAEENNLKDSLRFINDTLEEFNRSPQDGFKRKVDLNIEVKTDERSMSLDEYFAEVLTV